MTDFIRLEHVQLGYPAGRASDARAFYCDALGLQEVQPPSPLRGQWFRAGGVEIHLDIDDDFHAVPKAHPGIQVVGLEALAPRCVEAGYAARRDDRYPGRRRYYVSDPFGNCLELLEILE